MEKQTLGRSIITWLAALLPVLALTLGGCSGDSAPQAPINAATATVAAAADGKTDNEVTTATPDGSSTVTIPKGTAMYADAAKTQPVSGTLTVSTTTLATVSALPAAAQTGTLTGVGAVLDSVVAVADVTITNGITSVAAFGSPITVNLKLPAGYAAVGSSVDYYSFDASGTWTKEGTATVKADNSIDMIVSHLSGWGVATFKSAVGFTTDMLSGKTFMFSSVASTEIKEGNITFNTNGTVSGTMTGTWSITSSGQLITTFDSGETDTLTLISSTPSSFIATLSWRNGNNTGSSTITATVSGGASSGFTTAMLSGKTFTYVRAGTSTGTATLNADNTFISSTSEGSTHNGTWSINSSGQLVIKGGGGTQTDTMTLTNATASTFTVSSYEVDSSTNPPSTETVTIIFTVKSELPTATGFTTVMLSGKTFDFSISNGSRGTITFKADQTVTALRTAPGNETMTGTWSVNASGQAVITFSFGEVNTLTLTSATATSIVSALSWTNPNNPSDTGSGTMTLIVTN